jgi:SAM-dependent methyltransferase
MSRPPSESPAELLAYYDACLAHHGDTAQGAGWPNPQDRCRRFRVMRDVVWRGGPVGSLCDLGCGTGAFLDHLTRTGDAPSDYLGLDLSEAAIGLALRRHAAAVASGHARFVVADLLRTPLSRRFDHVVANGLFTVRAGLSEERMWAFMTDCLAAMWAATDRAMAFNVMSAVVDWRRDDLFHVETDRLLSFLHGLAGRRVILRADYDLFEYTAYVYRGAVDERG